MESKGWAPIHQAAFRNYAKQVQRIVETTGADQLETVTQDGLRNTPLLLAVLRHSKQAIDVLVGLGADVSALNAHNYGVVEICASQGYTDLLEHFISLKTTSLDVYGRLIKLFISEDDKETLCAGRAILTLGSSQEGQEMHTPSLIKGGLVMVAINQMKKTHCKEEVKEQALNILMNVLEDPSVKEQIYKGDGLTVLISLLHTESPTLCQGALLMTEAMVSHEKYASAFLQCNGLPVLLKVIRQAKESDREGHDDNVLITSLNSLGAIARASDSCREAVSKENELFPLLVQLLQETNSKRHLVVLCKAVSSVVMCHHGNQTAFIEKNGVTPLISLVKVKNREVQLSAINALNSLAEGNEAAQRLVQEQGGVKPLMQLLKKSRLVGTQEAVAGALWVLAGTDIDDQRNMATMIGVTHLSEFLDSPSEHLQLLGLEIFSILASGPKDFGRALAGMGVPQLLVRLLHSNNERIVLASVRTMRHICLGISWIPNTENQEMLLNSQGLNFLVALMSHSHSDLLQAEAACALASAVLGNRGNAELLYGHGDFSYSFILRLLYSQFREVRLLAGVAIATFAFNNMAQQKQIAEAGGVHWHNFQPFFLSSDPLERLNAAFQCVVLSSIIPNQKPASIRALGIKTIVDIMEEPHSKPVLALAADCVGRLAHTRAGIPSAIISINSVSVLCDLMTSSSEQIQGSAAIALGFLSFNHNGNRQLLKWSVMHVFHYTFLFIIYSILYSI
ncbi:ANKAR protein, partial [Polypterus senegalus]|nr:ANKAR protein [Polypterus senegalus]